MSVADARHPEAKFRGESGRPPEEEARLYVLGVMWAMLDYEPRDPDGWMFGGVVDAEDKRLLRAALKAEKTNLAKRKSRT